MKPRSTCLVAAIALGLVASCSGSGGDPPDAADGQVDAGRDAGDLPADADSQPDGDPSDVGDAYLDDGGDEAGDEADGTDRPDYDPTEEFLVVIPAGTRLCSTLNTARNWQGELPLLADIQLVEGQYVFPRRQMVFEVETIAGAHLGPDATALPPSALAGAVEVGRIEVAGDVQWVYTLQKQFTHASQPVAVEASFSLDSREGPWPEVVVLDAGFLEGHATGEMRLGPGEDHLTEQQLFASCTYSESSTRLYTGATAGGDRVQFEVGRCGWTCLGCFGFTECKFLIAADVDLDGQSRRVEDPFRLIYSADHHNDGEHFLARMEPPVGPVAAVLVIEAIPGLYPGELVRLDAGLQEIGREDLSEWTAPP